MIVSLFLQSFFDGWDCTKKKDKTKGRHDTLLGCESSELILYSIKEVTDNIVFQQFFIGLFLSVSDDRHRVKLHPLLGDPNSDYINANYIDVSLVLFFCLWLTWDANSNPISHSLQSHSPSLSFL